MVELNYNKRVKKLFKEAYSNGLKAVNTSKNRISPTSVDRCVCVLLRIPIEQIWVKTLTV